MENYNIIEETISGSIMGNVFWIAVLGSILIYNIIMIIRRSKKIKEKKYVNMYQYGSLFLVCIILLFFIVNFGIYLIINASTRIALIKDKQEQVIYTEEITFGYSALGGKHITLVIDKNNDDEKYYYIPDLPNLEELDISTGDKCIISYYKYSNVICDIELME